MNVLTAASIWLMLSFTPYLHFPPTPLTESVDNDLSYLEAFYKERHEHPEISLEEKETAARLTSELRQLGIEVTENFGGYGIVGILKNGNGPTILYRTDMDALPMYEKTGLPYASQKTITYNGDKTGAMHSCGHDMHMTAWIGTARQMVKLKNQWKGTLMLIGQPAEEIGAGAKLMLDAGLYEKFGEPKYGIALHCSPTIPAGKMGYGKGFTMASSESIDIKVFGVGAHGAAPHMSVDPIVIASMMVMELQTIVSRSLKPTDPAVITVGAIKGGTKHNIIPDEVTLKLTVRTFSDDVRAKIHQRIKEIARGVAIAAGMPEDRMPEVHIPDTKGLANWNDGLLVDKLTRSAATVIGAHQVTEAEPQMVSEDFALYGQYKVKIPTVLYWLGTVPAERMAKGDLPGLHSPYYYPDVKASLRTGVSVTTQSLLDLFNEKQGQ